MEDHTTPTSSPDAPTPPTNGAGAGGVALAEPTTTPWEEVERIIESGNGEHLEMFLQLLPPGETAYTIARLDEDDRTRLLALIRPDFAADLLEYLSDEQAADLIEELRPGIAAKIVDELDSDDIADILNALDDEDQQAILQRMSPEVAAEARRLIEYGAETAGGIMFTEYLAYPRDATVEQVIQDLRRRADEYAEYDVSYTHVVDDDQKLLGVVTMRNLLISPSGTPLTQIMIAEPARVTTDTPLDELEAIFDKYDFYGVPVVEADGTMVGVVPREAVEEALGERAEAQLQSLGGIIGGEELRTMSVASRSARRLMYLVPNIALMIVSISVIAMFEEAVLHKVIALAIFLPLVAGLSGCSGNQALAVSIRELSIGLAKPTDVMRVLGQEASVGAVNGLVMGLIVFAVTAVWASIEGWPGGLYLGIVVGGAIPLTILCSVLFGGVVPLLLKQVSLDPAMASGPIITTVVDFVSFLTVLTLAWVMIEYLV